MGLPSFAFDGPHGDSFIAQANRNGSYLSDALTIFQGAMFEFSRRKEISEQLVLAPEKLLKDEMIAKGAIWRTQEAYGSVVISIIHEKWRPHHKYNHAVIYLTVPQRRLRSSKNATFATEVRRTARCLIRATTEWNRLHSGATQTDSQLSLVRLSIMATPQGEDKQDLLDLAHQMRKGIKESYIEDVSPCLLFAFQEDAFRQDWLHDPS